MDSPLMYIVVIRETVLMCITSITMTCEFSSLILWFSFATMVPFIYEYNTFCLWSLELCILITMSICFAGS